MDWTELAKVAIPSAVGAGSAILSAVFTNMFAERRAARDLDVKRTELQQRLMESVLPARLRAYEDLYRLLQALKEDDAKVAEILNGIITNLLWIDSELAAEVVGTIRDATAPGVTSGERSQALAALQDRLRELTGAKRLNDLFRNIHSNEQGRNA